jgi:hypothetical protein
MRTELEHLAFWLLVELGDPRAAEHARHWWIVPAVLAGLLAAAVGWLAF